MHLINRPAMGNFPAQETAQLLNDTLMRVRIHIFEKKLCTECAHCSADCAE